MAVGVYLVGPNQTQLWLVCTLSTCASVGVLLVSGVLAWRKNNNQAGVTVTTDNNLLVTMIGGQILNGFLGVKLEIQKLSDCQTAV